ncbi:hypothetical protein LTR37_010271 [Vermiconidia calcicola]|uniref:Uncharacterized protein n=1 Tax=Vermiconidia calcicola TaxID=1690605 RepID=A0ACC3N5C9_9PEZI|nr:hypothetical protein LTR37_010271 [Vermiconidia calcicola]
MSTRFGRLHRAMRHYLKRRSASKFRCNRTQKTSKRTPLIRFMILRALNFWVYGHMRLAELTDDPNNRHLRIATKRLALIWKEYVLMLNEESMITLENGTRERTLAADEPIDIMRKSMYFNKAERIWYIKAVDELNNDLVLDFSELAEGSGKTIEDVYPEDYLCEPGLEPARPVFEQRGSYWAIPFLQMILTWTTRSNQSYAHLLVSTW